VRLLVVGHRGASGLAPENTIAAVQLAWDQGADVVEIDVHLSRDGRVMVIHDDDTVRTSGVALAVADTTAERLRELDVGSFKGPTFAGERIPFLEEVIATIPEGRLLLVHVRSDVGTAPAIGRAVQATGRALQILFQAFDPNVLLALRQYAPRVPLLLLLGSDARDLATLPKRVVDLGFQGVNIQINALTPQLILALKRMHLDVFGWTTEDASKAIALRDAWLDGILTDRPDVLAAVPR